jgi:hypothetical protein
MRSMFRVLAFVALLVGLGYGFSMQVAPAVVEMVGP